MTHPAWLTATVAALAAAVIGFVAGGLNVASGQSQSTEARTNGIIAVSTTVQDDGLLYLVDTRREVLLVYGYHVSGSRTPGGVRNGALEFLAGRLYRWDALLATKREYSIKGIDSLRGLRVGGPDGAKALFEKVGR